MISPCRTKRALFLVESLDLERATSFDGARWEHFQLDHLNDDSTFRIEDKSRQIAWSWLSAAEAIAEAILERRSSIFVSINQTEAKEKIRYAKQVLDALRPDRRLGLKRDNELQIELSNGARLTSLPARPPRGRAQTNIYLDEFAHVQYDRKIYTAAIPVISKGGRLRIGSSPMGAGGVFWEVFSEAMKRYPGYTRKTTPWWEVQAFCKNVAAARRMAPALLTAHRVDMFGNDRIKAIYANMVEEDFRQEYEAEFVDETVAWITWDEIRSAQMIDPELVCELAKGVDEGLASIERTAMLVRAGEIEATLAAGVDIGRFRNTTEMYVVGLTTVGSYPLRLAISLDNVEFDDQMSVLAAALEKLPIQTMQIDRTGLGQQLAEGMERRFPAKAIGVTFTNELKAYWATEAKMLIQQRKTPLPVDRDLSYQIHSIKKLVSAGKKLVFDTAASEKHHADRFWAWALALTATRVQLLEPADDELRKAFGWLA